MPEELGIEAVISSETPEKVAEGAIAELIKIEVATPREIEIKKLVTEQVSELFPIMVMSAGKRHMKTTCTIKVELEPDEAAPRLFNYKVTGNLSIKADQADGQLTLDL